MQSANPLRVLQENRIRSESDPVAMKTAMSRSSSFDVTKKRSHRQSSITAFIYKDPKEQVQTCSTPDKTKAKSTFDKEIQVDKIMEEQLCSENPGEEYWKELAIEREKALNETLEENKSLCELIQVRTAETEEIQEVLDEITKENSLLKKKAEQADVLQEMIVELLPADE